MAEDSIKKLGKQSQFKLKLLTVIIILIMISLSTLSLYTYRKADRQWNEIANNNLQIYALHDELVQLMGYGGLIHDFKNFVLRRDIDRYDDVIEQTFLDIDQTLTELQRFEEYNSESLAALEQTIEQYKQKFYLARKLIDEDSSPLEIDLQVRVDDTAALQALSDFQTKVRQTLDNQKLQLTKNFERAFTLQIAISMIFVLLLVFYFSYLLRANANQARLAKKALAGAQSKSDFLSNMSHEIRTPMNSIMGILQILGRDLNHQQDLKLVDRALFSAKSLLGIINDILDFSKIEARQLSLENIDFSIDMIVETTVSELAPYASRKSIYLKADIEEGMPTIRVGDPVRVKQILLNIVSNAVKFTEQGGVVIEVKEEQREDKKGVVFKITDTGIGISEAAVKHLFVRFNQADTSITRRYGGTGLGLTITQNLIELMGGNISVTSELGAGTCMRVYLPLTESSSPDNYTAVSEAVAPPNLEDLTILIAEDNDVNRIVIETMLSVTNATIHFAENGRIALEKFKQINPDLILMDIQMPEMDGIQACLAIRELNSSVPLIALTANVMKEDIMEYDAAGFTGHLAKPLDMNELNRTLTLQLVEST